MWIGESARWGRAQSRYRTLTARWPVLAQQLPRYFDVLADYGDADFRRLAEVLDWIANHPQSDLYPRQLPVSGLDSKWLDGRKGLLTDLVGYAELEIGPTYFWRVQALDGDGTASAPSVAGSFTYSVPVLQVTANVSGAQVFLYGNHGFAGQYLGDVMVPDDKVGLATICSIIFNGVFLKHGIPIDSKFGGILQVRDGNPLRFVELIHYSGSSRSKLWNGER